MRPTENNSYDKKICYGLYCRDTELRTNNYVQNQYATTRGIVSFIQKYPIENRELKA